MKRKLLIIILFAFIGWNNNAEAQTTVPGGNVSGVWTLSGSPYNVQGSIKIQNDSTLTIQPGVTINFHGTYKLVVLGRLLAIGTAADTITFTAINTGSGWRGIRFDTTTSNNDTSKIKYCKLQYGKATGPSPDDNGGAISFINFSKVVVSNCRITNCRAKFYGGGIYCNYSNPLITDNIISSDTATYGMGGGIYCTNSDVLISRNTISNNVVPGSAVTAYGGGIYCINGNSTISFNTITNNFADINGAGIFCTGNDSSTISNNIISENTTPNGAGGGVYTDVNNIITANTITNNNAGGGGGIYSSGSPIISNNTINNNTAFDGGGDGGGGGIMCSGNPIISNNIISNNTVSSSTGYGGGIYCNGGNPEITNTSIANNNAANGGALYCKNTSSPTLRNTILWGNTASVSASQVFLNDEPSDPNFYYCDVQGGTSAFDINGNFYTGAYSNNINSDPLFVAPSGGSGTGFNGTTANWSLLAASPCIDAGDPNSVYPTTDKTGNPRISGCIVDMGANEYQKGFSPSNFSQSPTICYGQNITVGIHTYSISATYTDTLTAFNSCDSIVTTILTVLPPNTFSQSITICAGQSLIVGSSTHTTSNTYTDVLTSFKNCDSTVTTNLTVLPAITFTQTDTLWAGQNITVGTHTYSTNGTFKDTLITASTCDSIVTTNLTILPSNTFSQTIAKPDHVVILMLENYGYSKIVGNPNAPHINALINDANAALFTQSYGLFHPSQPNYIALYSGNNQGIINNNQAPNLPFHTCNLGASLIDNGYSFKGYSEGLPSIGSLAWTSGRYVRRHSPWTNWQAPTPGINTVDSSTNQPYTNFPSNTNYNTLPTISFVIPNLDHDMHDPILLVPNYDSIAISVGDKWFYDNLTDYINWAKTNNSLFILTFDEDEVLTYGPIKSRILTLFVGEMIKGGTYSTYIDHYSVLRTLEDMYELPYCDSSAYASPIADCWLPISSGIYENTKVEQPIVYPNPTRGVFQIQNVESKVQYIKIYTIYGECIYESPTTSSIPTGSGIQINLSSQPDGIYFLQVKTDQGIKNQKIIICH